MIFQGIPYHDFSAEGRGEGLDDVRENELQRVRDQGNFCGKPVD